MSDSADLKAQYQKAFNDFAAGNYEAAISGYEQVIAANPGFTLAYQSIAEAYSKNGQLDEAVSFIRKAIELEPSESLFHTSLSRFLQQQGKIPEAEAAAADAARLQR